MFTWYWIFNSALFDAKGLFSYTYTVILDGIGERNILATKGELLGITYDGVFLPVMLNDKNPFSIDGYAVYIDENDDVYLGIAVPEDDGP